MVSKTICYLYNIDILKGDNDINILRGCTGEVFLALGDVY